jgi:hypothetical protein
MYQKGTFIGAKVVRIGDITKMGTVLSAELATFSGVLKITGSTLSALCIYLEYDAIDKASKTNLNNEADIAVRNL